MNLIALYLLLLVTTVATPLLAQQTAGGEKARQEIYSLIDQYAQAREKQDTILLKKILTSDIDQLVSTGEWRSGIKESIGGMKRSSESNPGSRRLVVEKIRFLNDESAIADARYEIQNPDGTMRKMWSTFIVVYQEKSWKISAIRNMLPTRQQ